MSYRTQAILAHDYLLQKRIAACAATQNIAEPNEWAAARMWAFSAEPGWDAKYSSALASEIENPGEDESVIDDHSILASVQAIISRQG